MQRFWMRLAVWLGKHAGVVAVVGLLITLVLGFGITQLKFQTGQDSYFNKSDQVYKDSVAYQSLFGGQAMLTLVTMDDGHKIDELFTAENRAKFTDAAEELRASDHVTSVISPVDVMDFNDALVATDTGNPLDSIAGAALFRAASEATGHDQQVRRADTAETLARLNAIPIDERTQDNPDWIKFLLYDNEGEVRVALRSFFPDDTHAQFITRLPGNASIEDEGKGADVTKEVTSQLEFPNASVVTTGAPVLLQDINNYLTGGMLTLGAIAAGIMVLILLIFFNVRWRLLPLGVIIIGLIWAFGAAGYLGIPLTVVTIAGLPVMMGIGIDYAIQMHARVEEEVVIDHMRHPIQETARNLCPALLVVTFDAVFAFCALQFAKVPMIRDFGLLLAVGIAVICFTSIIVPLASLGIREFKSPTKGRDFREGPLGRLTVFLGSLPALMAIPLTIASVVIFIGGISVEDKLTLQTDPIKWVNQDSQVIKDINTIDEETGSSSEFGVFIQSQDVFSQKSVDFIDEFTREQLAQHPDDLLTPSSMVATVSDLLVVPGASNVVPTSDEVQAAYDVAPPDIKQSLVAPDGQSANLIFRAGPQSLEERAVVVDDVQASADETQPDGVSATPSGLAVVGVGLLKNLEANRVELTYIALAFVFLFLAVRMRSVIRSLLSLVPVMIAVGTASLVAYVFSLKLSPMTAVGGPLVIAACTEFTSLILLRFVEERERGATPREAVDTAAGRTGRAFIVSAMTAVAGVAVIATSSLPLLRDFGILVAMNVAVALFSALVVLPPMLVFADSRKHAWVSKGLAKPDRVVEYIPTPPRPNDPEGVPARV